MARISLALVALVALVASLGLASALTPKTPAKPQVEQQLDEPSVKVVKITLAAGAILPEHTTPVHATVAAIAGAGEVTIAGKSHPLPAHGTVFLPKDIPHAVKNPGTVPLVLLVHHLKTTK